MRRSPWFWLLLSACGAGDDGDSAAEPDTALSDLSHTYSASEVSPAWTAQEAVDRLDSMIELGFPDPDDVRESYLEFMAQGDAGCPGHETLLTDDIILGCTAESGYSYAGIAVYDSNFMTLDEPAGWQGWYWAMDADCELTEPDGSSFGLGGASLHWVAWSPETGDQMWKGELTGSWRREGGEGWIGRDASALLDMRGGIWVSEERYELTLHGALKLDEQSVHFESLSFGTSCPDLPVGEVHIREDAGYWYVWSLGEPCSPCGPVVFNGEHDLGEACLDLAQFGVSVASSLYVDPASLSGEVGEGGDAGEGGG